LAAIEKDEQMADLVYKNDQSNRQDIFAHLLACDSTFSPPLSSRVSIAEYSAKLAESAERSEAWLGTRLVGLVAAYCNATDKQTAFVTNVSVDPAFQRKGIARTLLGNTIDNAQRLGFRQLLLEVDKRANGALKLYADLGFVPVREKDMKIVMSKKLEEGS
jgi:ribosomal protein S18 acetylase RimI-like enzyme